MPRRGWTLFAAMSAIWGVPYLLIAVAVDDVSPPVVVATRTGLAALVLTPIAARRGALRPALARWQPLLVFAILEMAAPWLLLTHAEQSMPSSLAGLLIASVPLVAAVTSAAMGDRTSLQGHRLLGLALGMVGVALVAGWGRESASWLSVVEVLLVAVGYATAPFLISRYLADVPSIGVVAGSLTIVTIGYLPAAIAFAPDELPPADTVWALVGLALVCTAIAFVVFFALIAEVGPTRSTLITFVNPAVAVALGVVVLDEPLTTGLVVGAPVVLLGCWLASRPTTTASSADTVVAPS